MNLIMQRTIQKRINFTFLHLNTQALKHSRTHLFLFFGDDTGNFWNHNSTIIDRCSRRAACFEEGLPLYPDENQLYVGIGGPSIIADCDNDATWTATIDEAFSTPTNYWWEWSPTGMGSWTYLGNLSSLYITNLSIFPDYFVLRLIVNDGDHYGQAQRSISRVFCLTGEKESQNRYLTKSEIVEDVNIYNIHGLKVYTGKILQNAYSNINLPPGVYIMIYTDSYGKHTSRKISIY